MDSEGSEQQEEAEFGWAVFPLAVWTLNFCLLWTRSSLTALFLLAEAALALLMLLVAFAVIVRQRRLPSPLSVLAWISLLGIFSASSLEARTVQARVLWAGPEQLVRDARELHQSVQAGHAPAVLQSGKDTLPASIAALSPERVLVDPTRIRVTLRTDFWLEESIEIDPGATPGRLYHPLQPEEIGRDCDWIWSQRKLAPGISWHHRST